MVEAPETRREAASKLYAESAISERAAAYEASRSFAVETLKALLILNGGAVIALLAYLGTLQNKETAAAVVFSKAMTIKLAKALAWFAGGLASAVLAAIMGYANWLLVAAGFPNPGEVRGWLLGQSIPDRRQHEKWGSGLTLALGIIAACFSLGSFCVAARIVYRAFLAVVLL